MRERADRQHAGRGRRGDGLNTPPHVGLHPADPFLAPPTQQAMVTQGSTSVLFGGMPAARIGSTGDLLRPARRAR